MTEDIEAKARALRAARARRHARTRRDRRFLYASSIAAVGLVVTALGLFDVTTASKGRSWPIIQGQVVAAEVEEFNPLARYRHQRGYNMWLSYTYAVGGKAYSGKSHYPKRVFVERPFYGFFSYRWRSSAEKAAARFPAGETLAVTYQPGAPGTSFPRSPIESAFGRSAMIEFVAGLLLLAVGLLGCWTSKGPSERLNG